MGRLSKHERIYVPLGELIRNRAKAMYPDDKERQEAFERGATWAFDIAFDDDKPEDLFKAENNNTNIQLQ